MPPASSRSRSKPGWMPAAFDDVGASATQFAFDHTEGWSLRREPGLQAVRKSTCPRTPLGFSCTALSSLSAREGSHDGWPSVRLSSMMKNANSGQTGRRGVGSRRSRSVRMYFCVVRLLTRMPSLSRSPRNRSAPPLFLLRRRLVTECDVLRSIECTSPGPAEASDRV